MAATQMPNLTLEQYHDRAEWSHSQIETFLQSPPLFHGRYISRIFPRETSDAFDDGTIVHASLTGEQKLDDILAIIPDSALNATRERRGKAWDEWKAANAGKIHRKPEECEALQLMYRSARDHPRSRWLLDAPGPFEHAIIWRDRETSLDLRARPDKITRIADGRVILVDIKTTRSTDHHKFASDLARYGYHRQAAWYCDGATELGHEIAAFCFITIDKTPAHECHVYELAPSAIEMGRMENRQLLRELAGRLERDDWASRDFGAILEIDLPTWAYRTNHEWRTAE